MVCQTIWPRRPWEARPSWIGAGSCGQNHFAVDMRYWPRAASVTSASLLNSVTHRVERSSTGAQINATDVQPPLFILGMWRSGTTHLHNLIARDRRFAYPTSFQVAAPHGFLTAGRQGRAMMQWLSPRTRPMDNVYYAADEPQEDEFALAARGLSHMLGAGVFAVVEIIIVVF